MWSRWNWNFIPSRLKVLEKNLLKIKNANKEIDTLTEEKYALEAEYRKLEAEVGTIKYIAEFVYGEQADKDLLEQAVRWVILLIIFVFDPLAVLLLIASQYTFERLRNQKEKDKDVFDWDDYEQKRAQAIVNNQPPKDTKEGNENERADDLDSSDEEPSEETRREEAEVARAASTTGPSCGSTWKQNRRRGRRRRALDQRDGREGKNAPTTL